MNQQSQGDDPQVTSAASPNVKKVPKMEIANLMTPTWLTLAQAAGRAQVAAATIRREIKRGRIRAARVGGRRSIRLRPEWVDAWLDVVAEPVEAPTIVTSGNRRFVAAPRHSLIPCGNSHV
jgi:excisionase family DNA binding protein